MYLPFDQLPSYLTSHGLVVVDFFTPTCGPCKQVVPMLQALQRSTGVDIVKVNVEESAGLLRHYRISSVPTLAIFQYGREVNRAIGVPSSAKRLVSLVKPYL